MVYGNMTSFNTRHITSALSTPPSRPRRLQTLAISVLISLAPAACAPREPYAAAAQHQTPGEAPWAETLTESDQATVRDAFADYAADAPATLPPVSPSSTPRWEDIPLALDYALDDAEVAIIESSIGPDRHTYTLKDADNIPGILRIDRTHDDSVYRAIATMGSVGEYPAVAAKLLEALDRRMVEAARKRRLPLE
jgi:hypothetical protein